MGGTPRTNEHLICRLSRETKQYSIRNQADGRLKHNKHSHGAVQKDLDTHRNFLLPLPKTGTLPYFKALNLFFESFVIIYNCLWKLYFLIAFLFFSFIDLLLFSVYYCIWCNLFMLLHVLCFKIDFFIIILKSPDILRDFPCLQSRLWWKICWCVVCCLCQISHIL